MPFLKRKPTPPLDVFARGRLPLVVLESPYAGDVPLNVAYARACLADSLARGEAPIASHLLYTQPGVLDDTDPEERARGMWAGHAWLPRAQAVVAYTDLGVSAGMLNGLELARLLGVPVYRRTLPTWSSSRKAEPWPT